ncbi:galactose oxidase [Gigaspora margarita]|uniref:Galactose oxidase n=1 Tax=Gigaspora margarita TaxID=4874 RepID=A0A8H4AR99_GIGMA|nr:galactose oxidase [Gigaspora margarita]
MPRETDIQSNERIHSIVYIFVSLLFNYINFAHCWFFTGGSNIKSYYINNKLYYVGLLDFFYIDLTNFDGNTIIDSSKWVKVNNTPDYSISKSPFLGGNANVKLFFVTVSSIGTSAGVYVDAFDTTLNKWVTNNSFTGKPTQFFEDFKSWTFDENTKKAYSLQEISGLIDIFDTVNLMWSNSSLIPQIYKTFAASSLSALYGPSQVLLSNGQILYFPSESSSTLYPTIDTTMTSILSYSIITNSWQFINSTGQIPNKRSDYTAVSTLDGRVIIYGGTSNKLSATPSIAVLNTSNYMWSTLSEVNPVGPLTSHSATMVNNYMIAAFGNYNCFTFYKRYIKEIITFIVFISSLPPLATHGIPSTSSSNNSSSNSSSSNNILPIVIGIGAGVLLIGILSFGGFLLYKNTRSKTKYIPTPGSNQLL